MSEQKENKSLALQEINALQVSKSFDQLIQIMPEHKEMLEVVKESLPEVQRATSLFYKTQSQFMDNLLTVNHYTPLRNLRQILAQMNTTRDALKESHFKLKKKEVEFKKKQRDYENLFTIDGNDERVLKFQNLDLDADLLEIEMAEILSQADTTRGYISGAIRQLTNYTEQYNNIVKTHGLEKWNESDFEREEEEYHIKKAFEQAICAARPRQGVIDEGNQIYFAQIGINGGAAQNLVYDFFQNEQKFMQDNQGKLPTHVALTDFLNRMAATFKGSAAGLAQSKGMTTVSHNALIQKGDDRLLLAQQTNKEE